MEVRPLPEASLEPTALPMPAVVGELDGVEVITTPSGKRVVDFGQNLTGHVRLTVRGEAGRTGYHPETMERAAR